MGPSGPARRVPPALDLKKITYQIGDHEEVIDLEKENENELKKDLKNIMRCYKEQRASHAGAQRAQQTRDAEIVIKRQDLVAKLNQFTNESKTGLAASLPGARRVLWNRIKELTGWKASKVELEQSDSEGEEGSFKYKIKYN